MMTIPATASQIISRARSIADLPNSKFIESDDESDSLNESWRDIYSKLIDADDDYYLTEASLTTGTAVTGTDCEYLITLPTDFLKIRYLDYQIAGNAWQPVQKFPLSMKDYNPGAPYYRIKNGTLWIIWSGLIGTGTLKLGYYPVPEFATTPNRDLAYGTSYTGATFPLVTSPVYALPLNNGVYVYNTNVIKAESVDSGTVSSPTSLLTTAGTRTNLVYYKGYLYWLEGGDVYRALASLTGTLTPAAVVTAGVVSSFAVFADHIYYCDASNISRSNLDGSSASVLLASTGSWICYCGGQTYYLSGTDVKRIGSAAVVQANVAACVTDGTYLYALSTAGVLNRLTLSGAYAVTATDQLRSDVATIGPVHGGRIPVITSETQEFLAIDTVVDYTFDYPSNIVPEIMAYQCAVDFRAKQKGDTTELKARLVDLWMRFGRMAKRDDYKPGRVQNVMDNGGSWR